MRLFDRLIKLIFLIFKVWWPLRCGRELDADPKMCAGTWFLTLKVSSCTLPTVQGSRTSCFPRSNIIIRAKHFIIIYTSQRHQNIFIFNSRIATTPLIIIWTLRNKKQCYRRRVGWMNKQNIFFVVSHNPTWRLL